MKAKGLDPAAFAVRLGYEPVAGIITVGAVSVESPEAAAVRMDRTKKVVILYLGNVFDAEPALRPSGARRCPGWTRRTTRASSLRGSRR